MQAIANQIEDFLNLAAWRRNVRGSLTRRWGDESVAVFFKWGSYRWVICGEPGTFSPKGYETEDDAIVELARELLN